MENLIKIKKLTVSAGETQILNGIDLSIKKGETHAIMGPNGSGKSTLALTIMGHPKYKVTGGSILFEDKDITTLPVDKRAQLGLFLAFQAPLEIEGITVHEFLYQIYQAKHKNLAKKPTISDFEKLLAESLKLLKIKNEFIGRHINVGMSGGERKKIEILQLAILQPKFVILDEIDSGLDVDALKDICRVLANMSILIITHYPRILNYLKPNAVHVMYNGTITKSGTAELAQEIEKEGYSNQPQTD